MPSQSSTCLFVLEQVPVIGPKMSQKPPRGFEDKKSEIFIDKFIYSHFLGKYSSPYENEIDPSNEIHQLK